MGENNIADNTFEGIIAYRTDIRIYQTIAGSLRLRNFFGFSLPCDNYLPVILFFFTCFAHHVIGVNL